MPSPETPELRTISALRCPAKLQNGLLALLVFHFLGVLSEPLRFFSRSDVRTGPEFALLSDLFKPYSQWLYMNHGYFFFAPNPGPGHLLQCTLSYSELPPNSQSEPQQGPNPSQRVGVVPLDPGRTIVLPDRKLHWPRLHYHRYLMLAEFYNSRFAPAVLSEEAKKDVPLMQRWAIDKELYDQLQTSISKSVMHSTQAKRVALKRLERLLPDSQQVLLDGWSLDDPRLLSVLSETLLEEPVVLPGKAFGAPADELPNKGTAEAKP